MTQNSIRAPLRPRMSAASRPLNRVFSGTRTPPAPCTPSAAAIHSWMLGAQMAARSPGSSPAAMADRVLASASSAKPGVAQPQLAVDEGLGVPEALGRPDDEPRDAPPLEIGAHGRSGYRRGARQDGGAFPGRVGSHPPGGSLNRWSVRHAPCSHPVTGAADQPSRAAADAARSATRTAPSGQKCHPSGLRRSWRWPSAAGSHRGAWPSSARSTGAGSANADVDGWRGRVLLEQRVDLVGAGVAARRLAEPEDVRARRGQDMGGVVEHALVGGDAVGLHPRQSHPPSITNTT